MNSRKDLEKLGFEGFVTVEALLADSGLIPRSCGIYAVLRTDGSAPVFLEQGTGGFFKGRNPNVTVETLEDKWVDGTDILYIGKAGGGTSSNTLYKRIRQYLSFGCGKNVGHWGGRYIWQLQGADRLLFAWKETPAGTLPRDEEHQLIGDFKRSHGGQLPFANLVE